jgi:hypothetical protein
VTLVACPRTGLPIFYAIFQTALAVLEDRRKIATTLVSRDWLALKENDHAITSLSVPINS